MPSRLVAHLLTASMAVAICIDSAFGLAPMSSPRQSPTAIAPLPPPPGQKMDNASKEFLAPHNQARAAVGVSPLKWSTNLATLTSLLVRYQRDKQGCNFANLTKHTYGANQLWASGLLVKPREAVESWVKEKMFYNYANNSCAMNHKCGVHTQMVWKKSLELGCAQASCAKDQATLTICFYYPPGNIIGERPY